MCLRYSLLCVRGLRRLPLCRLGCHGVENAGEVGQSLCELIQRVVGRCWCCNEIEPGGDVVDIAACIGTWIVGDDPFGVL